MTCSLQLGGHSRILLGRFESRCVVKEGCLADSDLLLRRCDGTFLSRFWGLCHGFIYFISVVSSQLPVSSECLKSRT